MLFQPLLKFGNLVHGNGGQIALGNGIDDADLLGNLFGGVVLLLQHGHDAFAQGKPLLGIGIQVGAELGKALQLPVLRVQQL